MPGRRLAALALAAAASVALPACESSQDKSARLKGSGATAAQLTTVKAGAVSQDVKVRSTTVLSSADGSAVVVSLENTGSRDQVAIPVRIRAKDAKGAQVYVNDLDGLQPALQQMAVLEAGATGYWVNDQVAGATRPKTATVRVGRAKTVTGPLPRIRLKDVRMDRDGSGAFARGVVENLSRETQVNMPIYGVVRRGGRVVAAGRALIERLNPEPQRKPTVFRIFFIGDPRGGKLSLAPRPTVLRKASA